MASFRSWASVALSVHLFYCLLSRSFAIPDVDPTSAFEANFDIMWANDHVRTSPDGSIWQIVLDQASGTGFQSKKSYRFGWFTMRLKLVPGDSSGVVTAYYLSSIVENRNEFDFEFLGNKTGEPYLLQTNLYVNGTGNREQRTYLWFDPSEQFHTYSILWNNKHTVFFVDEVPIRVHRNTRGTKHIYPSDQSMYIFSSIWNGDSWATRGGIDKINWEGAPFMAAYQNFHADACEWSENPYPACLATTNQQWWDQPAARTLTNSQRAAFKWATSKYLQYNYCTDTDRYPTPPVECAYNEAHRLI